ncbi:fumarylacetoacetate hydrolase family protein [Vogesella sp. LIG4]|uniref:fumarylacetoacetate hydrolase family protein n=1 Tax=Vogesella sp. LIG4 TaxID=1192162 RepID=UPI00081F9720|nr:fumarylacetoacetate hydrolase family protein [Vogesella sp. LIG4]SCK23100.1 2-keto-4-pentenoate hydratase [Vogesella sp. LIG4]
MLADAIRSAAVILAARRLSGQPGPLLAGGLEPLTVEDALDIQRDVSEMLGNSVAGWKCGMPGDGRVSVAPIYASTVFDASPCPVWVREGQVRAEPELAFVFAEGLPPRERPYSRDEVLLAVSKVHLALELIDSRFYADAKPPFLQSLADGLVNQGLLLGPAVNITHALTAGKLAIRVQQGTRDEELAGVHPAGDPLAPLLWLVEFLRQRGQGLLPGQAVITGSYAGVVNLQPDVPASLQFGALGELRALFHNR